MSRRGETATDGFRRGCRRELGGSRSTLSVALVDYYISSDCLSVVNLSRLSANESGRVRSGVPLVQVNSTSVCSATGRALLSTSAVNRERASERAVR